VTVTKFQDGILVSDEITNPIAGLDLALCAWASYYVFQSLEQYDKAQVWLSTFNQAVMNAMLADGRKSEDLVMEGFGPDAEVGLPDPWLDPFAGH
jgi:hypothetical protein